MSIDWNPIAHLGPVPINVYGVRQPWRILAFWESGLAGLAPFRSLPMPCGFVVLVFSVMTGSLLVRRWWSH